MFCPDCNHKLQPVQITTKDDSITLDLCKRCGGIWTDHAETNFFEESDLAQVKKLLPKKPHRDHSGPHICPHDRTKLEDLQHESVPHDITVKHCPVCSGNWFPYHQLDKFKHAQKTKVDYHRAWSIPLHSIYAILLPVLVVGIITAGLIGGIVGTQQRQTTEIRADDFTGKPTIVPISEIETMIIFTTKKSARSNIEYWIDPNEARTSIVSKDPQTTHSVRLQNLESGTYSYQITVEVDGRQLQSPEYTFEVGGGN